MFSVPFCFTVF